MENPFQKTEPNIKTVIKIKPEFTEKQRLSKVRSFWVNFMFYKQSTELWEKEDFEYIFHFKEELCRAAMVISEEGGHPCYAGDIISETVYNHNNNAIEKLREIYNNRFKDELSEDLTVYTNGEKFYLLEQTGYTDNENYKLLSETNKCKLLAKVLGCTTETAKKVKNKDHRYTVNEVSKKKIDTFLNSIK